MDTGGYRKGLMHQTGAELWDLQKIRLLSLHSFTNAYLPWTGIFFFINHTLNDTYPLFNASWWSLRKSLCFRGWTWTISRQGKETAPQEKCITKGKAHQEHTHLPSMISHAHPWDPEMLEAKWVQSQKEKKKMPKRSIHHQCLCRNLDNASMQKN